MGSGSRGRGRRRRRQGGGPGLDLIVHEAVGWELEDHLALKDYFEAHELLPMPMEAVPDFDLEPFAAVLGRPGASLEEKKRALIFLAHHRSDRACEVLLGQLARVEAGLERFARFAFEEALQWAPASDRRQGEAAMRQQRIDKRDDERDDGSWEGAGWLA